jgi:inorganic pyrophosphatase
LGDGARQTGIVREVSAGAEANPADRNETRVNSFWTYLDRLVASSGIVIDRPSGSRHPRYPEIVYPLDYGYLKGTSGGDGNEIDVWRGSQPDHRLDAVVCTVDLHKRDSEVKLLLGCTRAEMDTILQFHSDGAMAAVLVRREE